MSMRSITTWTYKREEPLLLARRFADQEGTALLYSGDRQEAVSSYLCLFPKEKISLKASPAAWDELKKQLGSFESEGSPLPAWVGYLGYEMGGFADPERVISPFCSQIPDALFYAPSAIIHFNHLDSRATLYGESVPFALEKASPEQKPPPFVLSYRSDTQASYLEKIAWIKEEILKGNVYQVNLSQEFHFQGECRPFSLFERICALNPSRFAAYMHCGDFTIISSSPEQFVRRQKESLLTCPIKGTAPRSLDPKQDEANRRALLTSEKERSELLMITDLMRSDLGKIALPGTVETQEIGRLETYSNVFHLLSLIRARVEKEKHPIDLLRPLFPGGSVTGCPKWRALEAIAQLEQRARGVYCGSLGYLAANGDFDFNIAIRTLIASGNTLRLQLGGGVVIDSDPVKEYEETLHKGRSLFTMLGLKELSHEPDLF